MLLQSREQAASNDPNGALASLLAAVQITHGERGVSQLLTRMQALGQQQQQEQQQEEDPMAAAYASLDALTRDSSTLLYQKGTHFLAILYQIQ